MDVTIQKLKRKDRCSKLYEMGDTASTEKWVGCIWGQKGENCCVTGCEKLMSRISTLLNPGNSGIFYEKNRKTSKSKKYKASVVKRNFTDMKSDSLLQERMNTK